ncbi:MAG: CHAT domain-containing tetratricopeptide repeat protein, partial [Bacteroidota bacterium]
IREKGHGQNHPRTASAYQKIGNVYAQFEHYPKALEHFEIAAKIYQEVYQARNIESATVYADMVRVFIQQKQLSKASKSIHHALYLARYDLNQPYNFESLALPNDTKPVFQALNDYYQAQWQQSGTTQYRDSLDIFHQTMVAFEDYIQTYYLESTTRQYYAEKALPVYEAALRHLYESKQDVKPDALFQIMEKNKSRQLLEQVKDQLIRFDGPIADSIKIKEYNLNIDIAYFEKVLYGAQSKTQIQRDSLVDAYQDKLFQLKNDRRALLLQLQERFPNYFQLKYGSTEISISQTQQWLQQGEHDALVEYFVGDNSLFMAVITKDNWAVQQVKLDFPLEEWVTKLRCGIFEGQVDTLLCSSISGADYNKLAFDLYQKLFSPLQSILANAHNILIVPDGVLNYLPFESLLTALPNPNTDFSQYPFLIKNYSLSYAYPVQLQQAMEAKKHLKPPTKSLLAFAPFFGEQDQVADSLMLASRFWDAEQFRNHWPALEYNDDEARLVTTLMNGDALFGQAATKSAFLKRAETYRIIHLATHGVADDKVGDYSYLAFQPLPDSDLESVLLYNKELYNLQLNADMVVLSACETGIGELKRGEGMISLARGFSYAGAKSIITTLWQIPDENTQVIVGNFYRYLK